MAKIATECLAVEHNYDSVPGAAYGNDARSAWQNAVVSEIVTEYGPHLRFYLSRSLRSPEDVEDMLQELYFRVADYADLANVESIKAFVFTIAANLLRDRSRRSYTRAAKCSVSTDTLEIPVETSDPERIIEDRDNLDQAYRVINRLQPNCRKAFLLHRIDGLSYKEIALKMGVTVSMVEKHIIEALKQLRQGVS